ncbi:MAG: hypothetical protein VX642_10230 [Bdellovibrionota bacterium]|nr:hypothetical protein [Bdellovibrionota bacterium]
MTKLVIALSFLISYQVYAKPVVEKQSSNSIRANIELNDKAEARTPSPQKKKQGNVRR